MGDFRLNTFTCMPADTHVSHTLNLSMEICFVKCNSTFTLVSHFFSCVSLFSSPFPYCTLVVYSLCALVQTSEHILFSEHPLFGPAGTLCPHSPPRPTPPTARSLPPQAPPSPAITALRPAHASRRPAHESTGHTTGHSA